MHKAVDSLCERMKTEQVRYTLDLSGAAPRLIFVLHKDVASCHGVVNARRSYSTCNMRFRDTRRQVKDAVGPPRSACFSAQLDHVLSATAFPYQVLLPAPLLLL